MLFENVADLCKKNNVSFASVEKSCSLTNGTISKLRTSMVSADKLKRIADYFDVSMEFLLTGKVGKDFEISNLERDLIVAFRMSDPGTQSAIMKILDLELIGKKENSAS